VDLRSLLVNARPESFRAIKLALTVALGIGSGSFCFRAIADIFDGFDAGNDNAWTRYEPLAPFGAPATYSFPNGGYRVQASASPDPAALGPGRAGSLRLDLNIAGNFLDTIDILSWDNSQSQSFGLLGRISNPGLGTTTGYAFTYSTAGLLTISLVNKDSLIVLKSRPIVLDPTLGYHLTFSGTGSALFGQLFELIPGGGYQGITGFGVIDSTYDRGVTGLEVFSNAGSGAADATFDNYIAFSFIPEPSTWSLMALGLGTFFLVAFRHHKARRPSGRIHNL